MGRPTTRSWRRSPRRTPAGVRCARSVQMLRYAP
jgi:hypothetical protein